MLISKTYSCGICLSTPDQISHHKSHIETQKHKDKKEIFKLNLSKLTCLELDQKYKTTIINDIITETETIIYNSHDKEIIHNKKLKQVYDNNEDDNNITQEMIALKKEFEHSIMISNKNALKDKIHEIHNYCRNNGVGYGMNALKVFNIFYGLKKIEENGLIDKLNLKGCEFSHLLEMANANKDEELTDFIRVNVLNSINETNIDAKKLIFYEIPIHNLNGNVLGHIIKEINKISLIEERCNVLLSGKIYEYFIGRDESAISELGAYFTDRHITNYCLRKGNPQINDNGSISTMVDMFGGSGGFTTEYINILNLRYPGIINWSTEINKIYHFDMNEDVIKSAGLEFFCLTGELPDMDMNVKYKNSFSDEFDDQKFKYIYTNPPYGGDKNKKTEAQQKRDKVKEYIKKELLNITDEGLRIKRQKQIKNIETLAKEEKKDNDKTKVCLSSSSDRIRKFAKKYGLKGNDKESCSLILLMDMVDDGGTVVGVLKEGVVFNSTYKDLRKCLVENFNVREIISIPSDQFENTKTKTSIFIFDNTTEKTTEVKFSELIVERYSEDKFDEIMGDIMIVECKGDIVGVSDSLVSQASKEEILSNPICSFNGKDYGKKELVVGEGYELVKLGDICESQNGYAFKTKDYKTKGVPLITITHIKNESIIFNNNNYIEENNKYTKYEIIQNDVIISLTGKKPTLCSIAINNTTHKQYLNQRCALLRNFKIIDKTYFAGIFNGFMLDYINKHIGNGSNQENVSLTDILNIPLPIPKSQSKIQEWVDKISAPYNEKITKQTQIKELEDFVQNRIKEIGENEDCDEVELQQITDINMGSTPSTKNHNYWDNGTIPWVAISDLDNNIVYNTNKCLTESGAETMKNRKISKNSILLSFKLSIGKLGIAGRDMYCNEAIVFLNSKIEHISQLYLYYLLSIADLTKYGRGTIGSNGNLNKEILKTLKFKIPKNKQLIQELDATFRQIETLQTEVKSSDELYKQLIQELSQEAIPIQETPSILSQPTINNHVELIQPEIKIKQKPTKGSLKNLKLKYKHINIIE
jgi:type I restriction enzyme S subunit